MIGVSSYSGMSIVRGLCRPAAQRTRTESNPKRKEDMWPLETVFL